LLNNLSAEKKLTEKEVDEIVETEKKALRKLKESGLVLDK